MARKHHVIVSAVLGGMDCEVTCEIEGRYLPASRWEPEEWPEVFVDHVREADSGALRDDLISEAEASDYVNRGAVEQALEDERDFYESAMEDRADARREERRMEEWR